MPPIIPTIRTRAQEEREQRRGRSILAPFEDAPAALKRPEWLKVRVRQGSNYLELKEIMRGAQLHTVCEEAHCPNIYECWEAREATFLVGGDLCTRRCGFCDVKTAKPAPLDPLEPARIAAAARRMGLRFAVVTGVARDDLADGGARHWAHVIHALREAVPGCGVEVLIPDFKPRRWTPRDALETVLRARPDVLAHNLETVPRLHSAIRPGFGYDASLALLKMVKAHDPSQVSKSNLIVGMGETTSELEQAMRDLHAAGCDVLTIGQYLQPSTSGHIPVARWVHPHEFASLKQYGEDELGFAWVESGPLVRSSYHAGKQFEAARRILSARG